jgi:hypothetical protein
MLSPKPDSPFTVPHCFIPRTENEAAGDESEHTANQMDSPSVIHDCQPPQRAGKSTANITQMISSVLTTIVTLHGQIVCAFFHHFLGVILIYRVFPVRSTKPNRSPRASIGVLGPIGLSL